MGYSFNLYLDRAISAKELTRLRSLPDSTERKAAEQQITSKPLQIFLYVRYPGHTLKTYVERKVTQKQWDAGKQRVDPKYYKAGPVELNDYLETVLKQAQRLNETNLLAGQQTTREQLRELVDKLNLKSSGPKALTLEEAYEEFLKMADHHRAANTRKNYVTVRNCLKDYGKAKRKPLDFALFTTAFPSAYSEYLSQTKGHGYNTIAKHLRILKTFLFFATDERGYNQVQEFRKWKSLSEKEKEVHVLTKEELMHLYNYNFESESYCKVRDVFCFACFTGLRYSDVENLRWEAVHNGSIKVLPVKTRHRDSKPITIPLNPFALAILKKYEGQPRPLPVISSQKTNAYLKLMGAQIGLTSPVKLLEHKGSTTLESYVPKHEVLTFHVARKTFITTSLILGIPERVVREFSGHKTEKDFAKYVKLADTYKEQHMLQAWSAAAFAPALIAPNSVGVTQEVQQMVAELKTITEALELQ